MKAELTTTLGEVYGGLGLFHQGEALIRQALPLTHVDPATRARQYAALGDAQARQGDYPGASASYQTALAESAKAAEPNPALTSRVLANLGDARFRMNDDAGASKVVNEALKLDLQRLGPGQPDVARDLEELADNDIGARRYDAARGRLQQALAIRVKTQGTMLPKVAEDLNGLGAIDYFLHRPAEAEAYYQRAMAVAQTVFGPNHPDTATIMNNIGRLMVERRAFGEAEPLLRRSVAVIVAQRDASFDDLAFSFDNLGLAERGLGREAAAEDLYLKALKAARVHNHRNVAPILVDLADLYCGRNRQREAVALLDEAAPIMAKAYASDPWRSGWVETIRGRCRLAAGDRAGALALLSASSAAIQARWPRDSLYGFRAAELLSAAHGGAPTGS